MKTPSDARFVRGTHHHQFRCGEWAEILMVAPSEGDGRDCYVVRFPDGVTDWWVVDDPWDPYEFSNDPEVLSVRPSE